MLDAHTATPQDWLSRPESVMFGGKQTAARVTEREQRVQYLLNNRLRIYSGIFVCVSMIAFQSELAKAQASLDPIITSTKQQLKMAIAIGSFEVKLTPVTDDDSPGGDNLGRMLIDKQFEGDLVAQSDGQMLTAMTSVAGSAGYVAVERVSGVLHEREGTFVLQHTGTMADGSQYLKISVVPDSGTGELIGLSGEMKITITEGKHFYEFEYTLDADS